MLSQFKWYRRLRGGRWGKVSGLFYDHAWIRVTDACVEDVDEDYTKPVHRGGQGQTPPPDEIRPSPPPSPPTKKERAIKIVAEWLADSVTESNLQRAEAEAKRAGVFTTEEAARAVTDSGSDMGITVTNMQLNVVNQKGKDRA